MAEVGKEWRKREKYRESKREKESKGATRETTARGGESTARARGGRDETARGFSMESLDWAIRFTLTKDPDVTQREVGALSAYVSSAAKCTTPIVTTRCLGF